MRKPNTELGTMSHSFRKHFPSVITKEGEIGKKLQRSQYCALRKQQKTFIAAMYAT